MTHPETVRQYLAKNGFRVVDEVLSLDRGKIYQTICAEYDGAVREFDDLTLAVGEHIIKKGGGLLSELLNTLKKQTERRIDGKTSGGESTEEERSLLLAISCILEEEK